MQLEIRDLALPAVSCGWIAIRIPNCTVCLCASLVCESCALPVATDGCVLCVTVD